MTIADLWLDPICPWSWLTARWLFEVERVRDLRVRLHVMSLSVLDGVGVDAEEDRRRWLPARVMMATELSLGGGAARKLYPPMASLIHRDCLRIDRDLFAAALSAADLPHSLANAATTAHYDGAIRASHRSGLAPMGGDIGSPILHLRRSAGGVVAFFGPVVTPAPRGEEAGLLWDNLSSAAEVESFYEFKRIRTTEPSFD